MSRVVFFAELFELGPEARATLDSAGAELVSCHSLDFEIVTALCAEADAVMTALVPIQAGAIGVMQRCRVISNLGVGYDHIDVAAAKARGVTVTHVPDYCTGEVADHTIALILALARGLPGLGRTIDSGGWVPSLTQPMRPLDELTLGIVGLGRIGRAVAHRAQGFGFRLLACDPRLGHAAFAEASAERATLERLLAESDIVTLHVPLTPETRHLVNAEALGRMKQGAYLVNTARGAVVDTDALADSLQCGHIGGAGLDVFEEEPLPADHSLRACEQAILTPHWAWHSSRSTVRLQVLAAEEAVRGLRGEPPRCPAEP